MLRVSFALSIFAGFLTVIVLVVLDLLEHMY